MFKTSFQREVRKEKYVRSDVLEEPNNPKHEAASAESKTVPGWASLQELNIRFARYINRARVLEQRNAVFCKQLETLQRMEEADGLEEAFNEQISINRQHVRDLQSDRARLERELKDAVCVLNDINTRYINECQHQEQLHGTLEQLNKEADAVLLRNLGYQIESQFLQDDINSTRGRHTKNFAEIQTYVNILHQINQKAALVVGVSEEQERLIAKRQVPALQGQLEECKSAICQLQEQKQRLQTEISMLEQTIKHTQENYDNEIQMYNEQIEALRKEIEEAENSLEKYTSECRQLARYQTSLENELERYKTIFESEDSRLNSAIIGTPISLLATNYRFTHSPTVTTSRGKDITQATQDILNVKPCQKNLTKKVIKKKELHPKAMTVIRQEEQGAVECTKEEREGVKEGEGEVKEHAPLGTDVDCKDVPDGAQISKALDTLCNIIRDRIRRYRRPEPIADFYTQGRYILVTGESSYQDPCFCTSAPSAGHVILIICNDTFPPCDPYDRRSPAPVPSTPTSLDPAPIPLTPPTPSEHNESRGQEGGNNGKGGNHKGRITDHQKAEDPGSPSMPEPDPKPCPSSYPTPDPHQAPDPSQPSDQDSDKSTDDGRWQWGFPAMTLPCSSDSMSYEKVEVIESTEKLSPDKKVKGYEETTVVVTTMIEKTRKKKHGNKDTEDYAKK